MLLRKLLKMGQVFSYYFLGKSITYEDECDGQKKSTGTKNKKTKKIDEESLIVELKTKKDDADEIPTDVDFEIDEHRQTAEKDLSSNETDSISDANEDLDEVKEINSNDKFDTKEIENLIDNFQKSLEIKPEIIPEIINHENVAVDEKMDETATNIKEIKLLEENASEFVSIPHEIEIPAEVEINTVNVLAEIKQEAVPLEEIMSPVVENKIETFEIEEPVQNQPKEDSASVLEIVEDNKMISKIESKIEIAPEVTPINEIRPEIVLTSVIVSNVELAPETVTNMEIEQEIIPKMEIALEIIQVQNKIEACTVEEIMTEILPVQNIVEIIPVENKVEIFEVEEAEIETKQDIAPEMEIIPETNKNHFVPAFDENEDFVSMEEHRHENETNQNEIKVLPAVEIKPEVEPIENKQEIAEEKIAQIVEAEVSYEETKQNLPVEDKIEILQENILQPRSLIDIVLDIAPIQIDTKNTEIINTKTEEEKTEPLKSETVSETQVLTENTERYLENLENSIPTEETERSVSRASKISDEDLISVSIQNYFQIP